MRANGRPARERTPSNCIFPGGTVSEEGKERAIPGGEGSELPSLLRQVRWAHGEAGRTGDELWISQGTSRT